MFDGELLLGTGGALKRALPVLGDAFFVLYGDSLLTCDLAAIERAFVASGRSGLMTVFRNDDRWDRSNVQFEEGRLIRYDKDKARQAPEMRHIDYGLGVLTARALAPFPARSSVRSRARVPATPRRRPTGGRRSFRAFLRNRIT